MAGATYPTLFFCVHCVFAVLQGAVTEDPHISSITSGRMTSPVQKDSHYAVSHKVSSHGMTRSTEPTAAVKTPTQSALSTSGTSFLNTTSLVLNITNNSSLTAKPDLMTSFTTLAAVSVFNVTSGNVTVHTGSADVVTASPGLVAILCIFFITLTLVVTIGIAKIVKSLKPRFGSLEDLPMEKMSEKSPFALYPPK